MAGSGFKAWTRERLSSAELQSYLQDQVTMVFPSASARGAALPNPSEGMSCYLLDELRHYDYIRGGWKRRSGASAANWPSTTTAVAGTGNITSAICAVNPDRGPYVVDISVGGLFLCSGTGVAELQMSVDGLVKARLTLHVTGTGQLRGGTVSRSFAVAGGGAMSIVGNLSIPAGVDAVGYTDDSHSFVTASWRAA